MSSFFEYVGQCMPQLTLGLKLTLQMTVFSLILAVVVGMVMCMFSISKVKPLNWISGIYLSLIRGTPLMVQAFFIYFGITGALHIRITPFSAAILVLCLNAGAYLSYGCCMIRNSIMPILPKGRWRRQEVWDCPMALR